MYFYNDDLKFCSADKYFTMLIRKLHVLMRKSVQTGLLKYFAVLTYICHNADVHSCNADDLTSCKFPLLKGKIFNVDVYGHHNADRYDVLGS